MVQQDYVDVFLFVKSKYKNVSISGQQTVQLLNAD